MSDFQVLADSAFPLILVSVGGERQYMPIREAGVAQARGVCDFEILDSALDIGLKPRHIVPSDIAEIDRVCASHRACT